MRYETVLWGESHIKIKLPNEYKLLAYEFFILNSFYQETVFYKCSSMFIYYQISIERIPFFLSYLSTNRFYWIF